MESELDTGSDLVQRPVCRPRWAAPNSSPTRSTFMFVKVPLMFSDLMVIQSHGVRFDSNQISEMDQGEHSGGRSDRQLRPPWRRVPQRLALVC